MPIQVGGGGVQPLPSTHFLAGYGGLSRMSKRYYDPERAWRAISSKRQGSVGGGLTYDHIADLTYNPLKYTVLSPSRDLTTPILNGQSAPRPRIGAFTLDMIDWNSNLAQLSGSAIGVNPPLIGQGSEGDLPGFLQDPITFLRERDIDLFRNGPARLFDYAAAPAALALKGMGVTPPTGDPQEEAHFYPFQKDPTYWAFLRDSDPNSRKQMAQYMADRTVDRSRNAYLREDLLAQFERDFDSLDGFSSGDARIDYLAKLSVWNERTNRNTLDFGGIEVNRPKRADMRGVYTLIPLVGTQVAQAMDDPKDTAAMEEMWRSLPPDERMSRLQGAGFLAMGGEILVTLPLFSGLGSVINLAKSGGFATIAARHATTVAHAQQIGRAAEVSAKLYDRTLRVTNGIMATGLSIATANWALSAVSPVYSETLGKEIDSSRVVSSSALAGVVNMTGYFTGFYGIETAIPSWYRAARGQSFASQVTGFYKQGLTGAPARTMRRQGVSDLSFHREYGGSKLGAIFEKELGIDRNLQGTALTVDFMTHWLNLRARELAEAYPAALDGRATGLPFIDKLPTVEQRMAELEGLLAMQVKYLHQNPELLVGAMNARMVDLGVNPGWSGRNLVKKLQQNARALDDETTVAMLDRYGTRFWPRKIPELEAQARAYLRGLGKGDDIRSLQAFAGKDTAKWHQVMRRLHQVLFHQRNAELHAAAEGSEEAARLGIVSQRHLFADEVEDIVTDLTGDPITGQALMQRLIETKDDVQDLHANDAFSTPEELAGLLLTIRPSLPSRRYMGAESADGALNDFQRVLDAEGHWTIGYKPTGNWTLPEGWVTAAELPPVGTKRQALTPDALRAMGYRPLQPREVMRGRDFTAREPIWPLAEFGGGVWIKEVAGETPNIRSSRNQPTTGPDSEALTFLKNEGQWDIDPYTDARPDAYNLEHEIDPDTGDFVWRRGGNVISDTPKMGAWWPVLRDRYTDERWLFKADWKKGDPNTGLPWGDLNPARRLSAPLVNKLMQFLDMPTVQEIPFEWQGVKGTIQRLLDGVDSIDDLSPAGLTDMLQNHPKWVQSLQENVLLDWLVSQHDTNAGSFLAWGGSAKPYAIDKGQAWAFFGKPEELRAFQDSSGMSYWGWRSPTALQTHLGEFLLDWMRDTGVVLNRQDVEPLLQKIEAIPESVFRDWLTPLAYQRVATGRFEATVDEFLDAMVARRDGMRAFVNRGYEHVGSYAIAKPGEPQVFKPGQMGPYHVEGSTVDVNAGPAIDRYWTDELAATEPPLPDSHGGRYKAGVIIEEWDQRVWVVDPRGQYAGHLSTFPKGRVEPYGDPGRIYTLDELRHSAAREVLEETGFDVQLTGHLMDHVDDKGTVTRYYTATRVGGGPRYAQMKETEAIVLLTPEQASARLLSLDDATGQPVPDAREQEVLQAYLDLRRGGKPNDPTMTSDPTIPGDPGVSPEDEFVSYVKLPNGQVFRSPWLDYPMAVPELIEMGNRSLHMSKFDDVFRGWRTYRLAESQRAAMHRRLAKLDVGLTPAKIDRLHQEVLDLAHKYRVPPQAVTTTPDWNLPFVQKAHEDLIETIEGIVGKGPYLRSDGQLVDINWKREISKAYQTSLKLNMTAGITSRFYTMGATGNAMSFVSHVIYPAFRFAFSPFFKAGEHVESWMLNALRGVNPLGDPFTENIMLAAGVGHARGQIRAELSSEPMLQGLSAFSVVNETTPRARDLWFRSPLGEGIISKAKRHMESPAKRPSLLESLFGRPELDEDLYPSTYPEDGLEVIRPHAPDPTGTEWLDMDGRTMDDKIIGERQRLWMQNSIGSLREGGDPERSLRLYAAGLAYIDSLGVDFLDRIAKAIRPMHTFRTNARTPFARLGEMIDDGQLPLTGPPGRGTSDIFGGQLTDQAAASTLTSPTGSVSDAERQMGHADAVYVGFDSWGIHGGADEGIYFVMAPTVYKKAVVTTHDRMGVMDQSPTRIQENVLSAEGAYRAQRLQVLQNIVSRVAHGTGDAGKLDEVISNNFGAMHPIELAVPGGLGWDDIEAVMLADSQLTEWMDFVETYADQVPQLRNIKVIGHEAHGSVGGALSRYWIEQAGLMDQIDMPNPRPFTDLPWSELARYLPDDLVTAETADEIIRILSGGDAGLLRQLGAGSEDDNYGRWLLVTNLEDELSRVITARQDEVRAAQSSFEHKTVYSYSAAAAIDVADAKGALHLKREALREATDLHGEIVSWRDSRVGSRFDSANDARAALGGEDDQAAQDWLAGYFELAARAETIIISHAPNRYPRDVSLLPRTVPIDDLRSRRRSAIFDQQIGDVVEDLPPAGTTGQRQDLDAQVTAYARYLMARFRELKPEGYTLGTTRGYGETYLGFSTRGEVLSFTESLTGNGALADALQQRVLAKTGVRPGLPIINVWVRGARATSGGRAKREIVIAVMGPDGQPYGGLSLADIEEAWREVGVPRLQSDYLTAGGQPQKMMEDAGWPGIWTPEEGPHGSIVSFTSKPTSAADVTVATSAGGFRYPQWFGHTDDFMPIRFAYHFEPEGAEAFMNLSHPRGNYGGDGMAWQKPDIREEAGYGFRSRLDADGNPEIVPSFDLDQATKRRWEMNLVTGGEHWMYDWTKFDAYTQVDIGTHYGWGVDQVDTMLDDILVQPWAAEPIRIDVWVTDRGSYDRVMASLFKRWVRGDLPDHWKIRTVDHANVPELVDDDTFRRMAGATDAFIAQTPEPAPGGLEDVPGGPEHLTEQLIARWRKEMASAVGERREALRRGWKAFWDPVPSKELQQDRLIQSIVARWYPELLAQHVPDMYKFMHETVKVPDGEMAGYLVEDRRLLQRWLDTGRREDFDALAMHAEKWSLDGSTRGELDSLYGKPEWNDMMEVMRMTARAAGDEAFGVHFFNPYRSSFERSINHPLLGVYPASWAYKVAKEWFRFLYDNQMFDGFRLGMAPAQYIANLQRQQSIAFAQENDTELGAWMKDGPLGSSIFIFNLLLPGDWSALPFPLSRSLRDAIRGQVDPTVHFRNNLFAMGLGRDIRLSTEVAGEWGDLIRGDAPPLREGERREETFLRR